MQGRPQRRGAFPVLAAALLFATIALGCTRKHPGPQECRSFALASLGIDPATPAHALAQRPELAQRAEDVTRRCLTTPWDRPLLACLSSGVSSVACVRSFERRRDGEDGELRLRW